MTRVKTGWIEQTLVHNRPQENHNKETCMGLLRRRFLSLAGTAGAIGGFPAIVGAQSRITLKIAHYLPAVHGLHTDFMAPWAKEIETKTNGAVTCQISPASSALGAAQNQLDQVLNGITDIGFGLCGNPRGRMTRSLIIEMPFLVRTAEAGSRAMWNLTPCCSV